MSEVVSVNADTMNDLGGANDDNNNNYYNNSTVDNNNTNNEQLQSVPLLPEQQQLQNNVIVPIDIRTMPLPPLRAQELLYANEYDKKVYWDRSHYDNIDKQLIALSKSCTLYVGNLNFTTRSCHVYDHFSMIGGTIQKIIMGMDRFKKIPCGFCFVLYYQRKHAIDAVSLLSGTKLDGSIIRVELDAGYKPGRQFGRGQSGGQVRHDRKAALALQQASNGAGQWQLQQQAPTQQNRFTNNNNNRNGGNGNNNNNNNYNVGDKRNRSYSTTSNTQQQISSSDVPTMDGALPTGRKQLQQQQQQQQDSGPVDTLTTTENNDNNQHQNSSMDSIIDGNDNNNEDAPPSKRQKT